MEVDLFHQSKKKVKKSNEGFYRDHSGPIDYNDEVLNDQEDMNSSQVHSYKETLMGKDSLNEDVFMKEIDHEKGIRM